MNQVKKKLLPSAQLKINGNIPSIIVNSYVTPKAVRGEVLRVLAGGQKEPGQSIGIAESRSMALGKVLIPHCVGEQYKLECSLCLCFLKHIMVSLLFNFCLLNLFISNRRVLKFQNIILFAVLSVFSSCTLVPYCVNFKSKFNQQMDLFINSRRITIQDKQAITKP